MSLIAISIVSSTHVIQPLSVSRALGRHHRCQLPMSQDVSASMEYCHGVGIRLAYLPAREVSTGLRVLRLPKPTLDRTFVVNLGKLGLSLESWISGQSPFDVSLIWDCSGVELS